MSNSLKIMQKKYPRIRKNPGAGIKLDIKKSPQPPFDKGGRRGDFPGYSNLSELAYVVADCFNDVWVVPVLRTYTLT